MKKFWKFLSHMVDLFVLWFSRNIILIRTICFVCINTRCFILILIIHCVYKHIKIICFVKSRTKLLLHFRSHLLSLRNNHSYYTIKITLKIQMRMSIVVIINVVLLSNQILEQQPLLTVLILLVSSGMTNFKQSNDSLMAIHNLQSSFGCF